MRLGGGGFLRGRIRSRLVGWLGSWHRGGGGGITCTLSLYLFLSLSLCAPCEREISVVQCGAVRCFRYIVEGGSLIV